MDAIVTPSGERIKNNTAMGRRLPDIEAWNGKLVEGARRLIDDLAARRLTPDTYIRAVKALYAREDPIAALTEWTGRALEEKADQVLWRKALPGRSQTFQLLYLQPGEVHPPHCHHNLISLQVVLRGRVQIREFDRVARLGPDRLLLRLRTDGRFGPGGAMETTEIDRNVHWFAADDNPAVILNFYILGYQDWTFDPADGRPQGRKMVDPTAKPQGDGLIEAAELALEDGYIRFGNKPLSAFPMPPC